MLKIDGADLPEIEKVRDQVATLFMDIVLTQRISGMYLLKGVVKEITAFLVATAIHQGHTTPSGVVEMVKSLWGKEWEAYCRDLFLFSLERAKAENTNGESNERD
jgi:hypothetical protein